MRMMLISLCVVAAGVSCGERDRAISSPTSPKPPANPRVVDYQPGIRIDYRVPQVEIDSEVILRKGELELFAYAKAPTPKEHETILLTHARPQAVYEALGLIGLTPGRPMRFIQETKTVELPAGDPVDVRMRWHSERGDQEASACDWMIDMARKAPMAPTHWLFCGSRRLEDGLLAADVEGTLVTVVDFPSSLLGLPATHSESDSDLWLTANTEAIPPVGTNVTLILRPAKVTQKRQNAETPK